jgi:ribosomal-protein-alanine N-acetyltransferase
MQITSMAIGEVDAVANLAADCGFHLDPARELQRSFAHIWVARLDSSAPAPDAFVLAWQAADELDIIALCTKFVVRRQGLAKALVRELLQFAVTRELRCVTLEVRNSNTAALQLYRSFGFQAGRVRENYYSEPTEDGIEMSLVIAESTGTIATEKPRLEA